jgi:ribosomal protein S8
VFLIMNYRVSIAQILARMQVAEKKKDLKVVIPFKKEVIPFLVELRREGVISKFAVHQKNILVCLKKKKTGSERCRGQRVLRGFNLEAILYRNPVALVFLSTTTGIRTLNTTPTSGQKRFGGVQLFVTY